MLSAMLNNSWSKGKICSNSFGLKNILIIIILIVFLFPQIGLKPNNCLLELETISLLVILPVKVYSLVKIDGLYPRLSEGAETIEY